MCITESSFFCSLQTAYYISIARYWTRDIDFKCFLFFFLKIFFWLLLKFMKSASALIYNKYYNRLHAAVNHGQFCLCSTVHICRLLFLTWRALGSLWNSATAFLTGPCSNIGKSLWFKHSSKWRLDGQLTTHQMYIKLYDRICEAMN